MNIKDKKVLVTAYSYSGITRDAAKMIAKTIGGDYKPIIPKQAYPKSYNDVLKTSKVEIEIEKEPELRDSIDLDGYDVVFVGTPNWYSTIAPPVRTLLNQNNFAGKTLVPFCTYGGGGKAECLNTMAKLASNANVVEGLAISSNDITQEKLNNFLNNIQL